MEPSHQLFTPKMTFFLLITHTMETSISSITFLGIWRISTTNNVFRSLHTAAIFRCVFVIRNPQKRHAPHPCTLKSDANYLYSVECFRRTKTKSSSSEDDVLTQSLLRKRKGEKSIVFILSVGYPDDHFSSWARSTHEKQRHTYTHARARTHTHTHTHTHTQERERKREHW